MILAEILAIETGSDTTYSVTLQSISRLDDKTYTVQVPHERNDWLEKSRLKKKPVGLDLENNDIFPSQIALEVERLYGGYQTEKGIPYFAAPRPSPIHLCEDNENFDKWLKVMTELEEKQQSAAIAVGGDDCIEDILVISLQDAQGFLGMVRK